MSGHFGGGRNGWKALTVSRLARASSSRSVMTSWLDRVRWSDIKALAFSILETAWFSSGELVMGGV